ncbi:hypothetical protein K435DRAFT_799928 [Dendrothele bispora CBS 962.96]|uniref:Uncharacterized protein n=1 Tax=Dendrothele bispora (strain CBS 962.96) TaxID=1314807 RepID=A0A4V4HF08_DENBC|nr:hypothetical protein K435DRAFT_799928 [Dendrothele bispora CBS 962.96]
MDGDQVREWVEVKNKCPECELELWVDIAGEGGRSAFQTLAIAAHVDVSCISKRALLALKLKLEYYRSHIPRKATPTGTINHAVSFIKVEHRGCGTLPFTASTHRVFFNALKWNGPVSQANYFY